MSKNELTSLTGEVLDYHKYFDNNLASVNISCSAIQCFYSLCFHDRLLALRFIKRNRPFANHIDSYYLCPMFLFCNGLVSLAIGRNLANQEEKDILAIKVKESITKLSTLTKDNVSNKI